MDLSGELSRSLRLAPLSVSGGLLHTLPDEACLGGPVKLTLSGRGVTGILRGVSLIFFIKLINTAPASFFSAASAEQSRKEQ